MQRARAELVGASAVWARVAMMHRVYTLSGHGHATVVDESGSTAANVCECYLRQSSRIVPMLDGTVVWTLLA